MKDLGTDWRWLEWRYGYNCIYLNLSKWSCKISNILLICSKKIAIVSWTSDYLDSLHCEVDMITSLIDYFMLLYAFYNTSED